MELDVLYFSSTSAKKSNYLGGGYLKDSIFSVSFSIFKTKNGKDFVIALPSKKNDEGNYVNLVEFKNKDLHMEARKLVKAKLVAAGVSLPSFLSNEGHEAEPKPTDTVDGSGAAPTTPSARVGTKKVPF